MSASSNLRNLTSSFSVFVLEDNTCRVCLTQDDNMHSLFYPELIPEGDCDVLDMFKCCTSLEASIDDPYPKHICDDCINELNEAYKFWKKCRDSIEELNRINKKINKDVEVKEELVELCDNDNYITEFDTNGTIVESDIEEKNDITGTNEPRRLSKDNKSENNKIIKFVRLRGNRRCHRCDIDFPSVEEYKKHAGRHNSFLCDQCGHISRSKNNFQEHIQTHSNLKPFQCTICNKAYKSMNSLNVHMKHHTGEQNYVCEYCGKKFVTWSMRFSHIRVHHTRDKKYSCDICLRRFPDSYRLKIHKRQHTGEKPFVCSVCDAAFKSCTELKNHNLIHSGVRKYSCTLCDKRFAKSSHVTQHMVTHTGERKHKCDICGKAFTQAHVLRSHLKIHEKERTDIGFSAVLE